MYSTFIVGQPLMVRLAINGSGGAETLLDLNALTGSGGLERIVPWSRLDIRSVGGLDVRWSAQSGEIAAGRYFTLPGGAINAIDGPGAFDRIYFLGGTAGADTVEIAVYR